MFKTVRNRIDMRQNTNPNIRSYVPINLMYKCPCCGHREFSETFESQKKICGSCGYHARLTAKERLALTVDEGTFVSWDDNLQSCNPIEFPGYSEKLIMLEKA